MGGERVELPRAQMLPQGGNSRLDGRVGQRRLAEGDLELGFGEWLGVGCTEMKGGHVGQAEAAV